MNILLIQPESNYPRQLDAPSQALLILGTLAENNGHNVKILHLGLWDRPLMVHLVDFKPDIVGITVNTFQVGSARYVIDMVRTFCKNTKIVIGGPHSEYLDRDVDERIIGEGENKWLRLLGCEPMIHLPAINYGLVNLNDFTGIGPIGATPSTCIMASRGCPSRCTFCNTPIFWGTKVRLGNPDYIIGEIERLHSKHGVKEIVFQDDTFNASVKWATGVLERIIKDQLEKEMMFRLVFRVNEKLVTPELLALAKRAGVWHIYYGVESGSQTMLDRMKKGITVEEVRRAVRITHEAGLQTFCSFIVGLPGETFGTIEETRKLIHEVKPTTHGWCFFIPFPGTEATREVISKGYLKNIDYAQYVVGPLYARTDEMTFENLEQFKGFEI